MVFHQLKFMQELWTRKFISSYLDKIENCWEFQDFLLFNTTLTTNHKIYYKEKNDEFSPKSRLWCVFELDYPLCIHAPFCIKWLIAFFFCLCIFTSFSTFTFEFMLIPSWSSHPLLFSWELESTHWVCIPS